MAEKPTPAWQITRWPSPDTLHEANQDSTWCCPYLETDGCDVIASLPRGHKKGAGVRHL